jgi:hypothetical protein
MLAESERQQRERQLPRTVRRDGDDEDADEDDDEDDDDVRHDRVSTLAAAQWKSLMASRTTAREGHAAATASLQVLSQFSDEATGSGGGGEGGGLGPLTRPPQHQQHRDQMLKRMEALRQEALSAQAYYHEEHRRLEVALKAVVEQQQLLHELGASPTSLRVGLLRPSIKRNAVAPVVVWRAHSDLDGSSSAINSASSTSSTSSTSAINSAINCAINCAKNSDVGSSSNQPHTGQGDAAHMADVSAPRDQALELHSSEATALRNGESDSSSPEIGNDGGADPSLTEAVTPTVGHGLGRRASRRFVRRIVPKSAATTGQQQRRSVLNDRRQATSSPSPTGSDNAAAAPGAFGSLEAARQRKKAADAKARAAKARKALSPEYMRKAAAAMFEKASVAQQNATQASRDEARAPSPIVS